MKHALGVASLILVAATAISCGGDAPSNASEKEFCDTYSKVDGADSLKEAKKVVDDMKETGTPEKISDDEREGFDIFIETIEKSDDDKDLEKNGKDLSKDDEKKVEKFITYLGKTCADELAPDEN